MVSNQSVIEVAPANDMTTPRLVRYACIGSKRNMFGSKDAERQLAKFA
jgi:hypothetical protein